jgi:hypothetical protein
MAAALFLAPTACSLGADEEAKPARGAAARLAATVDRLERATAERDYAAICDDLLTSAARERAGGPDCARLLRRAAKDIRRPSIEIRGIEVAGERATVRILTSAQGQAPLEDDLELRRQGGSWRVEALSGGPG